MSLQFITRADLVLWLVVSVVLPLLESCHAHGPTAGSLEQIQERGQIRVVVRNAPTSWYIGQDDEPTGPSFDLVSAFAASLGVEPVFVVEDTTAGVLTALSAGRADLAAAGLTPTEARGESFLFAPVAVDVAEQVVCHRDGPRPTSVSDLDGADLIVTADSSYIETLERLGEGRAISYETSDQSTEQLLAQVFARTVDCTVADSHIVAINRRYYPSLTVQFDLTRPGPLAWALPLGAERLAARVRDWLASDEAAATFAAVVERYFSFVDLYDFVDLREFIRRIDSRYLQLEPLFSAAARAHALDPVLLAAQAYQESHWNARARSPTGVRGIMMLTLPTARAMGVGNRLNPQQSIEGGARYLDRMRARIEEHVPEPDRTYLALAAYNIGFAHLRDARTLTRQQGLDPSSWADVRSVLPSLVQPAVYKSLLAGYARGHEPVRYVERIRNYADVLTVKLADRPTSGSSGAVERTESMVPENQR